METKVCKCCGRELPITEFKTGKNKYGTYTKSICSTCMGKRISDGYKKSMNEKTKANEVQLSNAKTLRLQDFTPRELMIELKRRGYEFEMDHTEVHHISSKNL